jgi:hypothetical protein
LLLSLNRGVKLAKRKQNSDSHKSIAAIIGIVILFSVIIYFGQPSKLSEPLLAVSDGAKLETLTNNLLTQNPSLSEGEALKKAEQILDLADEATQDNDLTSLSNAIAYETALSSEESTNLAVTSLKASAFAVEQTQEILNDLTQEDPSLSEGEASDLAGQAWGRWRRRSRTRRTYTSSCSDSDNGKNYEIKGITTLNYNNRKYDKPDDCHQNYKGTKDKYVVEWYCQGSTWKVEVHECAGKCSDGVCIASPPVVQQPPPIVQQPTIVNVTNDTSKYSCIDTDSGVDYYTKGIVTRNTPSQPSSYHDWCTNGVLKEFSCDGKTHNFTFFTCPNGCTDDKRACVKAKPGTNCTDSDRLAYIDGVYGGGATYYVKGKVTAPNLGGLKEDYCINNTHLTEYLCTDSKNGKSLITLCRTGCKDSACINGKYCNDGEDGINISNPSYVKVHIPGSRFWSTTTGDKCINETQLSEVFCENETIAERKITCPTGTECKGAACVKEIIPQVTFKCFDSDASKPSNGIYAGGGINVYKYSLSGKSLGHSGRLRDRCVDSKQINESICVNNMAASKIYTCPNGCENDHCLNATIPKSKCTDTDGGEDYFVKGKCTGNKGAFDDGCFNSTFLREAICGRNHPDCTFLGKNCPNGCQDGACVKAQKCTDTDGGEDYFVKGKCTGNKGAFDDGCFNSTFLREAICGRNHPDCTFLGKNCPNGCQDGACLQAQNTTCIDYDKNNPNDAANIGSAAWIQKSEYDTRYNRFTYSTVHRIQDACLGDTHVNESICVDNQLAHKKIACPYGCENDHCLNATIPKSKCTDTKKSTDPYAKGYINMGNTTYDECATGNNGVWKLNCASDSKIESTYYTCPNGCQDGACLAKSDCQNGEFRLSKPIDGKYYGAEKCVNGQWTSI